MDYDLKVKVAVYYYDGNFTQQEIANKLGLSRPTISKLLKKAREEQIVSITVNDQRAKHMVDLELAVSEMFNLRSVILFENDEGDEPQLGMKLGKAAASYFDRRIKDDLNVGLVGSHNVKFMIDNLKENKSIQNVKAYALLGGSQQFPMEASANLLCNRLVNKYNGTDVPLYSPMLTETEKIRDNISAGREIGRIVKGELELDVVVLPIGGKLSEDSNLYKTGYYTEEEVALIQKTAVGDVIARFIDPDGKVCDLEVNRRVVGYSIDALKDVKEVVGIAAGIHKAEAIFAALKAGYIDTLVTDRATCEKILSLANADN